MGNVYVLFDRFIAGLTQRENPANTFFPLAITTLKNIPNSQYIKRLKEFFL